MTMELKMKFFTNILLAFAVIGLIGCEYPSEEKRRAEQRAKLQAKRAAAQAENDRLMQVDTLGKWKEQTDSDKIKLLHIYIEGWDSPSPLRLLELELHGDPLSGYVPSVLVCLESYLPQFNASTVLGNAISWAAYSGCDGKIVPITELQK